MEVLRVCVCVCWGGGGEGLKANLLKKSMNEKLKFPEGRGWVEPTNHPLGK